MTRAPVVARERAAELLRDARVPGAVVARVSATGLGGVDAFGHADLAQPRGATADTAFHLYSGTKLFTAAAVMRLAERGDLDIDADIRPRCPDVPLPGPVYPSLDISFAVLTNLSQSRRLSRVLHTVCEEYRRGCVQRA